jgi:hypothetical protein
MLPGPCVSTGPCPTAAHTRALVSSLRAGQPSSSAIQPSIVALPRLQQTRQACCCGRCPGRASPVWDASHFSLLFNTYMRHVARRRGPAAPTRPIAPSCLGWLGFGSTVGTSTCIPRCVRYVPYKTPHTPPPPPPPPQTPPNPACTALREPRLRPWQPSIRSGSRTSGALFLPSIALASSARGGRLSRRPSKFFVGSLEPSASWLCHHCLHSLDFVQHARRRVFPGLDCLRHDSGAV